MYHSMRLQVGLRKHKGSIFFAQQSISTNSFYSAALGPNPGTESIIFSFRRKKINLRRDKPFRKKLKRESGFERSTTDKDEAPPHLNANKEMIINCFSLATEKIRLEYFFLFSGKNLLWKFFSNFFVRNVKGGVATTSTTAKFNSINININSTNININDATR